MEIETGVVKKKKIKNKQKNKKEYRQNVMEILKMVSSGKNKKLIKNQKNKIQKINTM